MCPQKTPQVAFFDAFPIESSPFPNLGAFWVTDQFFQDPQRGHPVKREVKGVWGDSLCGFMCWRFLQYVENDLIFLD